MWLGASGWVSCGTLPGAAATQMPSAAKQTANTYGNRCPERQKLLSKDQGGHEGHPEEAHHTEREEQQHQAPIAAEAVAACGFALDLSGLRVDIPVVEAARIPWRPLGRLLVEQGLLSEDELERALEEQASTGRRLGETLVELGFVSHTALSRALTEQYGIEPKSETGFGTGLRAGIERRNDRDRGEEIESQAASSDAMPLLRLVPEGEAPEPQADDGENLHLAQLEEQWAKLAAAEEQLAEAERELTALRQAARRRRDQAVRLVERIRKRDRRIAELSESETAPQPDAGGSRGHLVYAQLADRYVLVERDGDPPEPDAIVELPEVGEEKLLVCRVGRSPLPNDARPCAFAQQVPESHD
jgi:hypothetical protein